MKTATHSEKVVAFSTLPNSYTHTKRPNAYKQGRYIFFALFSHFSLVEIILNKQKVFSLNYHVHHIFGRSSPDNRFDGFCIMKDSWWLSCCVCFLFIIGRSSCFFLVVKPNKCPGCILCIQPSAVQGKTCASVWQLLKVLRIKTLDTFRSICM